MALTTTELAVAYLISVGYTVRDTAREMGLATGTVSNYRRDVYIKLGFNNHPSPNVMVATWFVKQERERKSLT